MKRVFASVAAVVLTLSVAIAAQGPGPTDWPAVAGDVGAMKYTALNQITPANVTRLTEVWTYKPGGPTPIVIDNVMYFVAGGNVVALNGDTGTEVWKFPLIRVTAGGAIRRGMTYWPGTANHPPRVLVTMSSGKLVQLDAKTGQLVPEVGLIDLENGIMDRIPGGEAYAYSTWSSLSTLYLVEGLR